MTHRERDRHIEGGTRGEREGPGESEGKKERGSMVWYQKPTADRSGRHKQNMSAHNDGAL